MTKFKLPNYRWRKSRWSIKNCAVFVATIILVLISAHAKSAHLGIDNNANAKNADATDAAEFAATAEQQSVALPQPLQSNAAKDESESMMLQQQQQQHQQHKHTNSNKQYHKHKQHHHNHEWEQLPQQPQHHHSQQHQGQFTPMQHWNSSTSGHKHHQHYHHQHAHSNLLLAEHQLYENGKRPYRSKYSIEELMNTKFPTKVSNDIDMDPCKASGFMGDIALPDVNYGDYPVVAHTVEWTPQADAPMRSPSSPQFEPKLKLNTTFQQELEILKQEVYHEGLQVEEEGMTDIIRKKTKLPSSTSLGSSNSNSNSNNKQAGQNIRDNFEERSRNEAAILPDNEPLKFSHFDTPSLAALKNFKSEMPLSPLPQQKPQPNLIHGSQQKETADYYELSKPIRVNAPEAAELTENSRQEMVFEKVASNLEQNAKSSDEQQVLQKLNKSAMASAVWNNRNVDQRKIQSNTKDIEDDSGNNFVSERKLVILPTSLPAQRSTAANIFSNAGGNGMRSDDIELLNMEHRGDTTARRRLRRRRKNRRSSEYNRSEYRAKLQQLREELNRPVRSEQQLRQQQIKFQQNTKQHQFAQHQQHHHHQQQQHGKDNIDPIDVAATSIAQPSEHQHHHSHHHQHHRQQHHHHHPQSFSETSEAHLFQQKDHSAYFNQTRPTKTFNYPNELPPLERMVYENDENGGEPHHHRMARAVTAKKDRVWDYGVIPYEIDGNFSGLHKALFKQAMRHWENSTCIKFVERDADIHPNYIVFTIRSCGCCSFVGKRGNGPQAISIGRNCDKFGIVVHELGHVVGFWHEHTRPDREKHVVIKLINIMKGQDYNFNKLTPDEVDSLGQPYDYDSIMHYARNTFSKGTYLDTILPIEEKGKSRPEIGQRLRLSQGDIAQANLLYKCPKCGRTFQENTGIFASPSYYTAGALSNETEHCEWRITATHGERVVLKLENLNILKSENCQTDYLEIRDGYYFKSPLIGRFCGKIASDTFSTQSSRMLLTYVNTHRSEGHRGFKAEYEVICGGELSVDDAEGRLESPNYPLDYLPNKECVWQITVPRGYQVALKFQSFEVENHDNCVYDYVEVRDGSSNGSPLIGVFCGNKAPPNMKSSGNAMYVKFVSDTSVQKAGFSAIFMKEVDECKTQNHGCEHECTNTLGGYECSCHIGYELHSDKKHCEDACGGVIEYPNGTITSPSFPALYPIMKECIWEIIAPPKHKISLNFTHFDLEGTSHQQSDCGYDYVTIYSKLSENRLKHIGTYCGSMIPPTATSEGNALRVEFHSDKSIQRSGFAAAFFTDIDECSVNNGGCQHECRNTIGSYICSCRNGYSLHENGHDCKEGECKYEINAPFGNIFSPNFPDPYPPNADCVWHFATVPGHRIKLIFNEFNVESHQECSYDHVAIYDGESESSSLLGRFCGDKIPYPISSLTNQLYMVLKTDKNKQMNGFSAIHSTSCGGYLRATNQIQQFYSHTLYAHNNYDENMDCEWTIQAPASSNVQLMFVTFDIESSENCTYDYVQVYSGMEDTSGPMYGQYCGNAIPQDIISMTDSLLVRFKTDSSVTMKGFSASYVAVDPFENSEEDGNSYNSAELATPFPGSLKSIYKEDTHESEDYDFLENRLGINNPNVISSSRLTFRYTDY